MQYSQVINATAPLPDFDLVSLLPVDGLYELQIVHLSLTPYQSGATGSLSTGIRYTDETGLYKAFPAASIDLSQPTHNSGSLLFSGKAGTPVRLFTGIANLTGSVSYLIKVSLRLIVP